MRCLLPLWTLALAFGILALGLNVVGPPRLRLHFSFDLEPAARAPSPTESASPREPPAPPPPREPPLPGRSVAKEKAHVEEPSHADAIRRAFSSAAEPESPCGRFAPPSDVEWAVRTGPTEMIGSRAFILASLLAEPSRLQRVVAVAESRDGRFVGVRFLSLPKGSWFETLGLLDGDVLLTMNGRPPSPSNAQEVYQDLRVAMELSLGVERAGEMVTLRYRIC